MAACSESRLLDWEANGLGNTGTVLGVNLVEVRKDTLLDVTAALAESTGNIFDDLCSHVVIEDLAEELTRLLVVGVGVLVWVSSNDGVDVLAMDGPLLAALNWTALGVWLVVDHAAHASSGDHHAVALVVWASEGLQVPWAVDGDVVVVGTESPSVGIGVVDESSLEHLAV